ncbi:efflux RND transporter periplasmic adaptor subunit [Aridibaculum aurantiacum]|uniref:efflux RND transporter periplasmic adaptor subunit n=1 Tax=Aridibaculum aurantiacum TaxID=2810307 RepID=UPI001A95FC41|nr:efflux RND transporter periplasmic adaptor subunit [Aridibaculum aurantiacum]
MNKKLLWIIISLVVVILLLVVLKSSGVIGKKEGTKVTAEKVVTRTIIETVTASGKVYPEVEVKVSPDISGEITELNVEEGDSVRRGQVLARIYADIYSTQRDQAAAGVNAQEAQVGNARAQLGALQATLEQAQANHSRQKQLLDEKVISRAEFEQADQALKSAKANYEAAQQGIRGNVASVQSARAQLQRAAKDVSRTTLVAPMNGIVSLLNVKKGERVVGTAQMAGTEMMRIADMNVFEVRVDVGENDIPKVHYGDTAIVEVDAYNKRKFKGLVTKIAASSTSAAQASMSNSDVTNYKVHIRLLPESYQDLIDPSKPKTFPFRPGMNASADIQSKTQANVIAVPINAVTTRLKNSDKSNKKDAKEEEETEASEFDRSASAEDELDEVVFVLQPDGKVKKVKVRTGIQDINYIEILSGLKVGDQVITGPYNIVSKTMKEGDKVQVTTKEKVFEKK